jgi:hypothetical protein
MGNSRILQKATKELTKAKAPKKSKDIIYDPAGQWKFPGQNTRIPGGNITMQGVPYPVYAQPNVGQPQMMYPGQEYMFPEADYVDEYPQMKRGGYMKKLVVMPKPSKKGLASKAYSRSLDATNKLFTENNLFKKPKDKKRKVFDPNAKYYASGGEYGMPLGTGVSQNFIGNRDNFNVGGIPNLPLRDNRVNYNAFVNGFDPMTKKQNGGDVNDFIELDLTPEEIQAYKDGGYVVEDISVPELIKAQTGLQKNTCPQGYRWDSNSKSCVSNFFTAPQETKKSIDPLDSTKKAAAIKTLKNPPVAKKTTEIQKVNSNSSIPKVQHIENSLDKPLSLSDNLKEFDNKVNSLVTSGDAARLLKDKYFAKDNTKSLEQLTREALTTDPNFLKKIDENKLEEFKQNEQKAYDNAGILQKTGNAVSAFMADPILTGANAMSGNRPLMGQSGALRDDQNTNQQYYKKITGADNNPINDLVNIINPASYATSSAVNANKGNYGQAALNLGEAFMAGTDLKGLTNIGTKGISSLSKLGDKTKNISNVAKTIPTKNTSGTLNAGISPELLKNAVGPSNKVGANLLDQAYVSPSMGVLNKTLNKISPLNYVPGYGKKLEGAVKPLGNVINKNIKNGNLVEQQGIIGKAKNVIGKGQADPITTKMNRTNTDIYAAKFDDAVDNSDIVLGDPMRQGFMGRTFNKKNALTPLQSKTTGNPLTEVSLLDEGVSLNRRLPFSNRYVDINKQKLLNNEFQWSTTGAGLQNVAEKFGKAIPVVGGAGAATAALTYDPYSDMDDEAKQFIKKNNITVEDLRKKGYSIPTRMQATKEGFLNSITAPTDFLSRPDPYYSKTILDATGYAKGGDVNNFIELDLTPEEIDEYKKGGWVIEYVD